MCFSPLDAQRSTRKRNKPQPSSCRMLHPAPFSLAGSGKVELLEPSSGVGIGIGEWMWWCGKLHPGNPWWCSFISWEILLLGWLLFSGELDLNNVLGHFKAFIRVFQCILGYFQCIFRVFQGQDWGTPSLSPNDGNQIQQLLLWKLREAAAAKTGDCNPWLTITIRGVGGQEALKLPSWATFIKSLL